MPANPGVVSNSVSLLSVRQGGKQFLVILLLLAAPSSLHLFQRIGGSTITDLWGFMQAKGELPKIATYSIDGSLTINWGTQLDETLRPLHLSQEKATQIPSISPTFHSSHNLFLYYILTLTFVKSNCYLIKDISLYRIAAGIESAKKTS